MKLKLSIACLYVFSCSVFANGAIKTIDHNLTAIDVAERSTQFAAEEGITVEEYTIVRLSYDYIVGKWLIYFEGKELLIGKHFMIVIDDASPDQIKMNRGR